jgi:hypothetical protein
MGEEMKKLNTRYVARVIAGYHKEHGLPVDRDRDWYWAEEIIRAWADEYYARRARERRKLGRARLVIKELVYVFLDNIKYSYTGKPVKRRWIWTTRAWLQDGLLLLTGLWQTLTNSEPTDTES